MRIAVVGDVHAAWDEQDCAELDAQGYDRVLFVGDLPDPLHRSTLAVARRIARLRTPALLIPGNHDGPSALGVLGEALHLPRRGSGAGLEQRARALQEALGPVQLVGFSAHPVPEHGLTVIAARPYAMDGRRASFADGLRRRYGLSTLAESARRLKELVDSTAGDLLFLAHNGPSGLGDGEGAPFALRGQGDLGDPDLAEAVAHAVGAGRRVRAIVAGHFHHDGQSRRWRSELHGAVVVNAARVPRAFRRDGVEVRHHVVLTVDGDQVTAEERLLPRGPAAGSGSA